MNYNAIDSVGIYIKAQWYNPSDLIGRTGVHRLDVVAVLCALQAEIVCMVRIDEQLLRRVQH
jgi:hypothetical protein